MSTYNGENVSIFVYNTILHTVKMSHKSDTSSFFDSAIIGRHTGILLDVFNVTLPVAFFATKSTIGALLGESNNTAF